MNLEKGTTVVVPALRPAVMAFLELREMGGNPVCISSRTRALLGDALSGRLYLLRPLRSQAEPGNAKNCYSF